MIVRKRLDVTGQRFGRLVALERVGARNYMSIWRCVCDCGSETNVAIGHLRNGHTKSCGCLKAQMAEETHLKHGHKRKKEVDRLYAVWRAMKQRCYLETADSFKYYGGRGIAVCEEWHDYETFKNWAYANGYNPNANFGECTIDRIDVSGNYCPENCRWVDMKEQNRNKRTGVESKENEV